MIRVSSDYYLTGATMNATPGLPILRDLVNWRWIAYAFDRLDLGPDFRLEGANVNRFGLQVFRATDPRGP
jgi:xylan 1,4-beta-xylosidase